MNIEGLDPEVARILRGKSGMERLRPAHEAWELAHNPLTAIRAKPPDRALHRAQHAVEKRLSR